MPDEYHALSAMARLIARESAQPDRLRVVPPGAPVPPGDAAIIDMQTVMKMLNP
jgi:hypothetical protein